MKEIKLTQGKVALVDDEDFEYLNQWKWCAHKAGNTFYAVREVRIEGREYNLSMHRLLLRLKKGDKPVVDHIDRDGLNNQRSNIRVCTTSQNMRNVKKFGEGSYSEYKGVTLNKRVNRWHARIRIAPGERLYLGSFDSDVQAALAYNEAAKKYHGEFACLNIIPAFFPHVGEVTKVKKRSLVGYDKSGDLVLEFETVQEAIDSGYNNVSRSIRTGVRSKGILFRYIKHDSNSGN